jgi:hypothetical protein
VHVNKGLRTFGPDVSGGFRAHGTPFLSPLLHIERLYPIARDSKIFTIIGYE